MDPKRLRTVPLFAGLRHKELEQLGTWTDEVEISAGKALTEEGKSAYEFFVIEEGTAEVRRGNEVVTTLGPGDFFGEIGLVQSGPRTASVVASSPMRLIVMARREFAAMESRMPSVAAQLRAKVQERTARNLRG